MKNELIENSKLRARAGCNFLLETFSELDISNNEAIRQSHIGKESFYGMKQGKLINLDAFLRLKDYAFRQLQQQVRMKRLPPNILTEWKERLRQIMLDSPTSGF